MNNSDFEIEIYELHSSRIMHLAECFGGKGDAKETNAFLKSECDYFKEVFSFALLLCEVFEFFNEAQKRGKLVDVFSSEKNTYEKLKEYNSALYNGISPKTYESSFTNPEVSVKAFGTELGRLMSMAIAELRAAIPAVYSGDYASLNMRLSLMLQIYSSILSIAEDREEGATKDSEKITKVITDQIREILYEYVYDYMDVQTTLKLRSQIVPGDNSWAGTDFATTADELILYLTGEYVGDNEISMYKYLKTLPIDVLKSMADTYTQGYVLGFEVTGRDLSIKDTAELRFNIGFLPMIEIAVANLKEHKLMSSTMRAGYSIFTGRNVDKNGFFGGNINPQFDYDHKDDMALFLDERLNERRLQCIKESFEEYKHEAKVYAGPAVIDIFGEELFEPVDKAAATQHTDVTRKLVTEYASKAGSITNEYIPGDERSFTIIAFPMPSIGDEFEAIFFDTIKINTLDYVMYRDIQQKIIDTLDMAEYVFIRGKNENKTELNIRLHTLTDPAHQTNFENCVADVNIPVGEVFTSPLLAGTSGILNVCKVFLNGLEYRNLTLEIEDGKIKNYSCDNFNTGDVDKDKASGRKMIEDNILYHHDTLPMGECAIGTNTTAYEVARRYGIEAKFPILIAEKTGPHFAFGDTCYSHCEDLVVYNPDGKEIIARDNECSLLRKSEPDKAYFNCHTDITIPYDELGEVSAKLPDGSMIPIILDGRFVLEGCEELNIPLDKCR